MIAALFIDPKGPYPTIPDVDCWPLSRDARKYEGPHPVVAHPPCRLWVNLACVNYKRWGGEHNRPGNDDGCFAWALTTVMRYGGVLEHPAESRAWRKYGLDTPRGIGWQGHGQDWFCEVWQSAYGHLARKRTWLFYRGRDPLPGNWERKPGTHQCGKFDRRKPSLFRAAASRTPLPFALWLVELARRAGC